MNRKATINSLQESTFPHKKRARRTHTAFIGSCKSSMDTFKNGSTINLLTKRQTDGNFGEIVESIRENETIRPMTKASSTENLESAMNTIYTPIYKFRQVSK